MFVAAGPRQADSDNHRIRKVDLRAKYVTTLAGTGECGGCLAAIPAYWPMERAGPHVCVSAGSKNGPLSTCTFNYPRKLALDASRTLLFVAEAGDYIRVLDLQKGHVILVCFPEVFVVAHCHW